jgi:hypothetical protein
LCCVLRSPNERAEDETQHDTNPGKTAHAVCARHSRMREDTTLRSPPHTPTSMDAAFCVLNVLRSRRHFTPSSHSNTGVLPLAHPRLATLRSLSVSLSAAACNGRLRRQTRREPSFWRARDELAPADPGTDRRVRVVGGLIFECQRGQRPNFSISFFTFTTLGNDKYTNLSRSLLPGSLGAVWCSQIG